VLWTPVPLLLGARGDSSLTTTLFRSAFIIRNFIRLSGTPECEPFTDGSMSRELFLKSRSEVLRRATLLAHVGRPEKDCFVPCYNFKEATNFISCEKVRSLVRLNFLPFASFFAAFFNTVSCSNFRL